MLVALLLSPNSPLTQAILHKRSCGRSILLLHFNAGMRIIIIVNRQCLLREGSRCSKFDMVRVEGIL